MNRFQAVLLSGLFLASSGYAQMPRLPQFLRLQGRFTDTRVPLTDNLPVRVSIWDSSDGFGNLLWDDVQNVAVQNDMFQVILGRKKVLPPSIFSGGDRWVELQVGSDAPIRPRYKIPDQYLQAEVAALQAHPVPVEPATAAPVQAVPVAPPAPVPTPAPVAVVTTPPAPVVAVPAPAPAQQPTRTVKKKRASPSAETATGPSYEVQSGDTLKSIAQKLYGNSELWYDLYYLNRDRLGPMGHLFAGQILVLPSQAPTGAQH